MIYIMSGYEKVDFFVIFDVRASKWLKNGPEVDNVLNIVSK